MKRLILCSPIYDFQNNCFTIGGIQTYIRDLADICIRNSMSVVLVLMREEYSDYKEILLGDLKIEQHAAIIKRGKFCVQAVFDRVYAKYNSNETIFVIDTDQRDIKSKDNNVVTIQHGIAFDIPGNMITGIWGKCGFLQSINKLLRCIKNRNRLSYTRNTVCVDYNYFNWYRTIGTIKTNVAVIPNYSSGYLPLLEVKDKISTMQKPLRFVFARRFVDYRGTIIFMNVVQRLYMDGYDFYVTFSGTGPLYDSVQEKFKNNLKVNFTSFDSKESIEFHRHYDVAVVPTIYSEGTSLSLCEAMSAGCIPLCTHVGGMTNMILDGFNGLMCYPSEEDLYLKMKSLLDMRVEDLKELAFNAYLSAIKSFSKQRWGHQWLLFLDKIYDIIK